MSTVLLTMIPRSRKDSLCTAHLWSGMQAERERDATWPRSITRNGVCLFRRREHSEPKACGTRSTTAHGQFQQQQPFDEPAFLVAIERLGVGADWIVLPDIVEGGLPSLDYSLKWKERLRGMPSQLLIAVQDGMQLEDVASFLSPTVGIFVGGSTPWKEATAEAWGSLARRRNCHLHVGRVNSARRIRICAAAGANSFDGTSASRFSKTLPRLDRATRQSDMFAAAAETLEDAQRATANRRL